MSINGNGINKTGRTKVVRGKSGSSGFQTRRIKEKLNTLPENGWIGVGREMMRSGAWRALSIHARRTLDRIMIEHIDHAAQENGRLKVTWLDFEKFGVHRSKVRQAIQDLNQDA